ncbi:MAG: 50S ribosomal protein L24 [Planctomycetes bacterium]|nr:50S ribosomal protein L24 [Planctomycetota bacterium]MCW8140002.1 50S ribosomal protein L24 [Planctomycetota bacterium]
MAHTGKGQKRYLRAAKVHGKPETKHLQKLHVKKDDDVLVLSGADKGKTGKVLRAIPAKGEVVVQGVNRRWKHLRRTQQNPQGGRVEREFPIPACKVRKVQES